MTTCAQNFDADTIVRARRGELPAGELAPVLEHVATCEACSAVSRGLERVKLAWSDAALESPSVERVRDLAAMRTFSLRAARSRRSAFGFGLGVGLSVAAAAAAVVFLRMDHGTAVDGAKLGVPVAVAPSSAPAAPAAPAASGLVPREKWRGPIVTRACASCASKDGALAAGFVFSAPSRVDVPQGADLRLALSVEDALEDPLSGVVVEGPAVVGALADAVALDLGKARVSTHRAAAVRTPHLVANSATARWVVESSARGTRVDVLAGTVTLSTSAGMPLATVEQGKHLSVTPDGQIEVEAPPPAPVRTSPTAPSMALPAVQAPSREAPSSSTRWAAAQSALSGGDRTTAEGELRALIAEAASGEPLVPRATFVLAELELAHGHADEARRRLRGLVASSDAQLAEDTTTLLAQSHPDPAERAQVWGAYVATNPPSPRRERALYEQARGLASAGDREAARRIATQLCAEETPEGVRRSSCELLQRL